MFTYFSPHGRATRLEYWGLHLLIIVVSVAGLVGGYALVRPASHAAAAGRVVHLPPLATFIPLVAWFALSAWAGLCLSIKRCHDRDRSGWFLLVQFIPVAGLLWCLVELGFLPGTRGPNRYDPAAPYEPFQDSYAD